MSATITAWVSLGVSILAMILSVFKVGETFYGLTARAKREKQPVLQISEETLRVPWHRVRYDKTRSRWIIPGWGTASLNQEAVDEARRLNSGWFMEDITASSEPEQNYVATTSYPL
jgi:hypothetical protein